MRREKGRKGEKGEKGEREERERRKGGRKGRQSCVGDIPEPAWRKPHDLAMY